MVPPAQPPQPQPRNRNSNVKQRTTTPRRSTSCAASTTWTCGCWAWPPPPRCCCPTAARTWAPGARTLPARWAGRAGRWEVERRMQLAARLARLAVWSRRNTSPAHFPGSHTAGSPSRWASPGLRITRPWLFPCHARLPRASLPSPAPLQAQPLDFTRFADHLANNYVPNSVIIDCTASGERKLAVLLCCAHP